MEDMEIMVEKAIKAYAVKVLSDIRRLAKSNDNVETWDFIVGDRIQRLYDEMEELDGRSQGKMA